MDRRKILGIGVGSILIAGGVSYLMSDKNNFGLILILRCYDF